MILLGFGTRRDFISSDLIARPSVYISPPPGPDPRPPATAHNHLSPERAAADVTIACTITARLIRNGGDPRPRRQSMSAPPLLLPARPRGPYRVSDDGPMPIRGPF